MHENADMGALALANSLNLLIKNEGSMNTFSSEKNRQSKIVMASAQKNKKSKIIDNDNDLFVLIL